MKKTKKITANAAETCNDAGMVHAGGHSFMKRSVLCTPALNVLSKDQHRATVPMRREQWEALSGWSDARGTTASEVVRVLVADFLNETDV